MKKHSILTAIAFIALMGCKSAQQKKAIQFPDFSAEAHRGGRGLMPENTIIAMQNAMSLPQITTLEMDTHITKDNKVIVVHDDYMNPNFVLSPEGNDIPKADAKKYVVYGLNYDVLKTFDVGSRKYTNFPQQKKIKAYMPLLADLIDSVQKEIKLKNKKQYFYNIETKCDEEGDNITNPTPEVFVKLLMDVIEKKKITPYVVIQSFDKRTIQIVHKKYPHVRTSYLVEKNEKYEQILASLGYKPFIISPNYKMVYAAFVNKAHADGIKVIPWTANTTEEINRLKLLRVDGIISDYPNLL
jgi:glycerophosphoryl diester phosphodiesterase